MSRAGLASFTAGAALTAFAAGHAFAAATCPLEVVGTWRLLDAAEVRTTLLSFTANGWANVLNGPGEQSPSDIAAQVRYRLEPRGIDFEARRGNDVFMAGTTHWEITAHTEDSFTTRASQSVEGIQDVWQRVQTHRYFLTFAARNAPGESAAFVMWTTLDGRRTELDALGSMHKAGVTRFGRIPFELARAFAAQGDPKHDVMMRIELSEAEYRRTRAVHRTRVAAAGQGPRQDPDIQAAKLIEAVIESLNSCAPRIRHASGQRPTEQVRALRQENDRRHVPDKAFPARWKPADLS